MAKIQKPHRHLHLGGIALVAGALLLSIGTTRNLGGSVLGSQACDSFRFVQPTQPVSGLMNLDFITPGEAKNIQSVQVSVGGEGLTAAQRVERSSLWRAPWSTAGLADGRYAAQAEVHFKDGSICHSSPYAIEVAH